jgi:hypothetical protein
VQQRGIEGGELVALQAADDVGGRVRPVEAFELLGDRVETPERAAVVVLVVAF